MATHAGSSNRAVIHRMVMPHHTCPYGLKAVHLLRPSGFEVDDRHLTTREETDAFKAQHGVATTPQVFIDGTRLGTTTSGASLASRWSTPRRRATAR